MSALDSPYWDSYAQDHSKHYNEEMAKFIRDLAVSLRVQSVLEIGCSAGNDLKLFAQEFDVRGIDSSRIAIEQARKNLPGFSFEAGQVESIPFEDNSIDIVFTRNLFNHVESVKIDEMFRVSKKYIFNIELFSENEQKLGDNPITY
ncbi:MAG: class I SAM-dependent methyltransferase, partial [Nitrosopumilaceae archaeon]|nr:class I SAM-dependent methyltransferase [Nitrosopumilaceae archaeon]